MAEALVGGKAETSSLCGVVLRHTFARYAVDHCQTLLCVNIALVGREAVVAGGLAVVHRLIIGVPIRHIDLRPGVPMICREVEVAHARPRSVTEARLYRMRRLARVRTGHQRGSFQLQGESSERLRCGFTGRFGHS